MHARQRGPEADLSLLFCHRLSAAVVLHAVSEASGGNRAAREWLETDSEDLAFWCDRVGISSAALRKALEDPTWPEKLAVAKAHFTRGGNAA